MADKGDYIPEMEIYRCIKYGSRLECKTCDGFGRNSDEKVNTENCYNTKESVSKIIQILYEIKKNYPNNA
jgi:hypothetical protein